MTSYGPDENQPGRTIPWVLLASALAGSFLHLVFSLLISAAEQDFPAIFLANLAATTLFLTAVHFSFWYVLAAPIARVSKLRTMPAVLATCLFFLTLSVLFPLVEFSVSNTRYLFFPLCLAAGAVLFSAPVLGYLGALPCLAYRGFHLGLATGLRVLPPISLATLALVWVLQTSVRIRDRTTGLPTTTASIALVLYLLVVAAILTYGYRRSREARPPARALIIWSVLAVAAPTLPFLATQLDARGNHSSTSTNVPIRQILLITVDTLRADALGTYDPASQLTPRIDRLASESVVFRNSRSPAPHTKPAIASILTGLSPSLHGAVSPITSLEEEARTVAEILRKKGYATGAIGRNSNLSPVFDFDQGFDTYEMHLGSAVRTNPSFGTKLLQWGGIGMAEPSTDRLADAAGSWLRRHRQQPFFFWLHFFDPHTPFAPPPEWLPKSTSGKDLPSTFDDTAKIREGVRVFSASQRDWVRELYRAEVRYVDQAVGSVLDAALELGIYEDSLIIFASDHGEEFFEHGSIGHGHTLYDEVLRVPLLVKLPGKEFAGPVDAQVSTESITPTILQLASIPFAPGDFSSPPLPGPWRSALESAEEKAVVSGAMLYYEDRIALTFGGWKYIRATESGFEELYSLELDSSELTSVAASNPDVIDRARTLLARYMERTRLLRKQLNLEEAGTPDSRLKKDVLEDLKALGYL